MPVHFIIKGLSEGFPSIPYLYPVLKVVPWLLLLAVLKVYFGGARNKSERLMHSKVVMITGGTSGIGASIAHELASRGAQIILLTQHPPSDIFLVDYIQDLRNSTKNQLIYAEQVDLSSLHSIRTFATKWVDNAPPRRLDMIILCGNTAVPQGGKKKITKDGLDEEWQVNYLANFHLLSILSPAIRAQPPDRDIRIVFATCSSYIGGTMDPKQTEGAAIANTTATKPRGKGKTAAATRTNTNKRKNHNMFGMTKLALMTFANSFQSHLSSYKRPDNFPVNARVLIVDPGFCRTPGTRRWLTRGSLLGLLFYLMTWPLWWLILKSPEQGAQSFLYATMEAKFGRGTGGPYLIKECREVDFLRKEIKDEAIAKQLWEFSEKQIEAKEKEGAVKRALEKKEKEEEEKKKKQQQDTSTSTTTEGSGSAKSQQTPGSRRSRKAK
ncbi:hypothetical protein Plec18167_008196 [Paecilomyces lecythidis]|uniref:Oxidoreductase n=1 Tax=Paecilomyces lecythidis TaxID=3004212 RepID=A0ABR3WYZ3_9EURO